MPNTLVGMRADDLLDSIVHSYVDVATLSTLINKGNQERRLLFIQNDGNTDVYIMFNRPAAIHQGLCIKANGGTAMFSACNSSLCSKDLFGITKSPQPVRVLVTEGF